MKILALDVGDVWVGSAISDGLGITCRPYRTVKFQELEKFICDVLDSESVATILVGHPVTVGGTSSEQTKRIEEIFEQLKKKFDSVSWKLWDERFSTKRALSMMKGTKKEKKEQKEHSVAAAFILQNYLDHLAYHAE